MLYNVLPPLLFFLSFAGIIILVSRVVMRSRREAFSHSMRMQASSQTSIMPEGLLNPGVSSVELLRTRAGVVASGIKGTLSSTKEYWAMRKDRKAIKQAERQAKKEEKKRAAEEVVTQETSPSAIAIPHSNWRERAFSKIKDSTKGINTVLQKVKEKVPQKEAEIKTASVSLQEQPAPVKATPQIRIIRVDSKPAVNKPIESTEEMTVVSPAKSETPSPQGRFIARIKKAQAPKSSILEQVSDAIVSGQLQQAEEMLIPYIVKNTKDCQAYMLLGKVAIAKGAWDEAIEVFQQVINLDPQVNDAQASLGYAALQKGKFTIALQALQRAHAADPENIQILDYILDIARRLDNKVLQKSVLEQLIELQPNNKEATENLKQLV